MISRSPNPGALSAVLHVSVLVGVLCWGPNSALANEIDTTPPPAESFELPQVEAPGYRPRIEASAIWVLELRLDGEILNPGLLAIDHHDQLLLPLSELVDTFEIAIDVDPPRARAGGFVVHSARTFELDLSDHELRIEGRQQPFDSSRIAIWSQDIYVDAQSLSHWLPVDIEVDRRMMRIEARSREPLPVAKRQARERLHERLGMKTQSQGGSARETPYRWWSPPAFDVNLRSRVTRPASGNHDWNSHFDIAGSGDLMKMHTEFLWTGVDDRSLRLRARAGRRDPEGRMGGALRLHEFTLGDVTTPALNQLSNGRSGRGIQISSFPLNHLNELGQLSLEGDLPPGYQVEVYRGDSLLDFQNSDETLRYRFENVPTVPGLNVLRLVFYGPRGEWREETRRIWADGGLAKPGESRFRVTANQHNLDTLQLGDIGGDNRLRGELRAFGEFEHGLTKRLTLSLGGSSIPLHEGRHHYGSLGLRTTIGRHLLRFEGLGNQDGGFVGGAGWQSRFGDHSVGLSHHEFNDFLSERTRQIGGKRLRGRSEASLDGRFQLGGFPVAYRALAGHSRLQRGDVDFDGLLRLSTWLRPLSLTHTLRGRVDRDLDVDQRTLSGDFLASYRRGTFGARSRFFYDAMPGKARALSLIGEWSPRRFATTRLGMSHSFGDRTTFLASLSRSLGVFRLSADISVDEKGVAAAGVGISFGSTPDPFLSRPRLQGPGATRSGSIAARAFLDRDANGQLDPGDDPVANVGFTRGGRKLRTNADGTVLLTQIPADTPLEIAIDPSTVHDPYWLVPDQRERLVLRPGTPAQLDFPIVPVGEIEGWVMQDQYAESLPLVGLSVQLIDEQGEVVKTTRTEVDGFYILQELLPGRYRLRVDPSQVAQLGLESPATRDVEVREGGAALQDQTFHLRLP